MVVTESGIVISSRPEYPKTNFPMLVMDSGISTSLSMLQLSKA